MHLVLGIDAGGTSSRAALFTVDGEPVGSGRASGANPVTLGMERAGANLTAAVEAAAPATLLAQVESVVVGLAGHPGRCRALAEQVFRRLLPDGPPVRVVGDVVTAFAAGTAAPSGTVLISGTGAIAAKITNHERTATSDGYGWLLGDEGSAFWLGHAAARTAIRALSPATRPTVRAQSPATRTAIRVLSPATRPTVQAAHSGHGTLVALVVRHLLPRGAGEDAVEELAAAVHAAPPLALAELAPLVSLAAEAGDPAASAIVAEAASRLARTAADVHEPGLPIVLAGSVLTESAQVRRSVTELLAGETVAIAGDTAGAAAWLAAAPLLRPEEAARTHHRFVAPAAHEPARSDSLGPPATEPA
ncbi:N-acetylglucosamine kinase-like BadF-type ATPase [Nonomuraea polychroma]|uniref:N-acetylglucosamine kinase-like BadF-type ATPase n=1 Tax=Nonomuraea polychroma TaxID=46176 RepID=A0A438LWV3_9ACTN|nr:BadF/BadG/BcrA/BcrD ATPase family protein [Nonomuraea polychroma]RVX37962.1 N-acetylglucosamine kinase-like BadF-type ATPase [Nonomuraea polychroma]